MFVIRYLLLSRKSLRTVVEPSFGIRLARVEAEVSCIGIVKTHLIEVPQSLEIAAPSALKVPFG